MMDELTFRIPIWSGVATLCLFGAGAVLLSLAEWARKGSGAGLVDMVGRVLGVVVLSLVPVAFVSVAGLVAAAIVDAAGTPPIAFPFVTAAGLAGLRVASESRKGGEMAGCNKMIGIVLACYAAVWGAVAWWASGGPATLVADLSSLRWLQPPLAALPFAVALWRIAGTKRTAWLLAGALIFLSAYFALWFFTVEAGFGAALLPASDWLRFPIAGVAAGLLLSLSPLARALSQQGARRGRALRDSARNMLQFALITLPMGLARALAIAL